MIGIPQTKRTRYRCGKSYSKRTERALVAAFVIGPLPFAIEFGGPEATPKYIQGLDSC